MNYHIGRLVLSSLCVGDLVRLVLSGARFAGWSTAFTSYVLNMFRTLIYPSPGAYDCVDELPHRSFCSQFVVCWRFGEAGFEWCSFCRLKHSCASACKTSTTQNHPPSSSAEVKERVELYVCCTCMPSWLVTGRPLPLPLHFT